jgi:hypothetical protein
MLNRIHAAVVATALAAATPALAAGPRYETRRLPNGPRPDRYVPVRTDARRKPPAPCALTGPATIRAQRRLTHRWVGPRYIGPVWTTVYVEE